MGNMCTAVLIGWDPTAPLHLPYIWAHIWERYWSAKIDNISLWPPWWDTNWGSRRSHSTWREGEGFRGWSRRNSPSDILIPQAKGLGKGSGQSGPEYDGGLKAGTDIYTVKSITRGKLNGGAFLANIFSHTIQGFPVLLAPYSITHTTEINTIKGSR